MVEDIIFSSLRFLILIDSILVELIMKCRNFIFKLFTKEQRNSLSLPLMIYVAHVCCCRKGCKSLIPICYLHDFFLCSFHFILALDEVMVEVISFDVCRSFLIICLFFLDILIKKSFLIQIFLCSLFLSRIDLRMLAVIHGFLAHVETLFFNNFICTTKFKRMCRLSFTKKIS